jgi:hypothetical protein
MPPFTGDGIGAGQYLAVDDDAAAHTRAENHAEHHRCTRTRAIGRFGQREAVGIVGDAHFALQQCFQIAFERLADQTGRVGILDQAAAARFGAGDANADTRHRTASAVRVDTVPSAAALGHNSLFCRSDQVGHHLQRRFVIALRRRHALAQQHFATIAQRDDFDLAAAEVDANPHQDALICRTDP